MPSARLSSFHVSCVFAVTVLISGVKCLLRNSLNFMCLVYSLSLSLFHVSSARLSSFHVSRVFAVIVVILCVFIIVTIVISCVLCLRHNCRHCMRLPRTQNISLQLLPRIRKLADYSMRWWRLTADLCLCSNGGRRCVKCWSSSQTRRPTRTSCTDWSSGTSSSWSGPKMKRRMVSSGHQLKCLCSSFVQQAVFGF